MTDVIVVGARPAGAATAMLLARAGLRVLALDRARFPSDTLSSHQIQTPGVALLRRWGLLDRLGAAPVTRVRFDPGVEVLTGDFPDFDGGHALYSPRRTVLDAVLVDAARAAGAEVREEFDVVSVDRDDTGRVIGVTGRPRGAAGAPETIRAALVVGADGKRSTVAAAVGARASRARDGLALAAYTYWSGLPMTVGELYQRPGRAVAAFPTNDDLTMVYVAAPRAELPAFRAEDAYLATLDRCGDLGERVRAATRAERYRLAPDQPNAVRRSHGPGWALAGDAGLVLDSVTAQGISNALRDADRLAAHVIRAAAANRPLDTHLATYQRERDASRRPMYDFTVRQASFAPSAAADALFRALAGRPDEISRFLGVFAGAAPMGPYFGAGNMRRLLGSRTLARIALARLFGR
jgi:flavin-dependent dehydrogenase